MNRDGSSPQNLSYNLGSLLLPSRSPDGTRILFMTFREAGVPGHNIGVMSSIGTDHTVLYRGGELNTAAWSPDGQRIVFTRLQFPPRGTSRLADLGDECERSRRGDVDQ